VNSVVGDAVHRDLIEPMRERLLPWLPRELEDDVPVLAMEVAGAIGGNGQALGLAVRKWANRSALLASGDLSGALSALALANGLQGLSSDSGQRLGWIAGNQETRDLIGICANEGFLRAYRESP
jgi:hypothetical protein